MAEGNVATGTTRESSPNGLVLIDVGTRVEVRNKFLGSWSRGFEVYEHRNGGYGIKRLSDTSILPGDFDPYDVRAERRRHDFWWY